MTSPATFIDQAQVAARIAELGRRPQPRTGRRLAIGELIAEVDGVHHHRPELHPHSFLERIGSIDALVDRCGFRQGDQHHLATCRVGQHRRHVVGLVGAVHVARAFGERVHRVHIS